MEGLESSLMFDVGFGETRRRRSHLVLLMIWSGAECFDEQSGRVMEEVTQEHRNRTRRLKCGVVAGLLVDALGLPKMEAIEVMWEERTYSACSFSCQALPCEHLVPWNHQGQHSEFSN